jgi:hypothetical protein
MREAVLAYLGPFFHELRDIYEFEVTTKVGGSTSIVVLLAHVGIGSILIPSDGQARS